MAKFQFTVTTEKKEYALWSAVEGAVLRIDPTHEFTDVGKIERLCDYCGKPLLVGGLDSTATNCGKLVHHPECFSDHYDQCKECKG